MRLLLQGIITALIRPYIVRELPGWGRLSAIFLQDPSDPLWRQAPLREMRNKLTGYLMHLDISHWPDRMTFFLGRWYDLETQLFIAGVLKKGDTVIDVGANRGDFALAAAHLVGESGKVIAFEPNPAPADMLEREISANGIHNITLHRIGLGNENANLILTVPKSNSGGGTLGKSDYSAVDVYQLTVPIMIGDEVLRNERPVLMKIDVEGFECSVLEGMRGVIQKHQPIVITEVVPHFLERCGSSVQQLREIMETLGYQGFRLELRGKTWSGKGVKVSLSRLPEDRGFYDAVWINANQAKPVLSG
jgi:FkbM family methyltransferase